MSDDTQNQANTSVDQDILLLILKNLVTAPDEVKVQRKIDEQGVLLSVIVNASDMGIVIGRSGSMASAIKTIMRAVGKANSMNVRIQFLEPDGSVRFADKKDKKANDKNGKPNSNQNLEGASVDSSTTKAEASSLDDDLADFVIN